MANNPQQSDFTNAKQAAQQSLGQAKESTLHAKAGVQATVEGMTNSIQGTANYAKDCTVRMYTDTKDKAGETVTQVRDGISNLVQNTKSTTNESAQQAKQGTEKAQEQGKGYMQSITDTVSQKAGALKETLMGKPEEPKNEVDTHASEEGKGYLQSVGETVAKTATALKETLVGKSEQAQGAAQEKLSNGK